MNARPILIVLTLGLGSTLMLLWQFGRMPNPTYAQGLDGYDTYYVAPGGDCGGMLPCFDRIQAAIDAVDSSSDAVKIAAGVYTDISSRQGVTQVVYLSKTLTLRGGYIKTDWGTSDPQSNPTVLDARGRGRVLYIDGSDYITPTIEGLSISGGAADWYGGGVYIYASSPTLTQNYIIDNFAVNGGGIGIQYGSPVLTHNTILSNSASNDGGGIGIQDGSPILSHNTIVSNSASHYGGGVYMFRGSPTIESNQIMSNTTSNNGGGLFIDDYSSPIVVNNIIAHNRASSNGGGIYIDWFAAPSVVNNTIVSNNRGPAWANEAIFMYNTPSPIIVNNIIVTHTYCIRGIPDTIVLDYNVLRNCEIPYEGVPPGSHDIYADPRLTDDRHLSINSPAINAALASLAPSTDFDDDLRPAGLGYDIGADEYYGPALAAYKQATSSVVHPGKSLTYTLRVTNTGTVSLTVLITDNLPEHTAPTGILTWTQTFAAPGEAWVRQVVITAKIGYVGTLTNVLQAGSFEGAAGIYTVTTSAGFPIYFPFILRGD